MTMKSILTRIHRASAPFQSSEDGVALDLFSCLPFELHTLIIGYLEPDDLVAALNVSRSLRHIWLSEETWPAIADRWHPGLANYIRATAVDGQGMGEVFRRHLQKIRRRVNGKFTTALHHEMDLEADSFFQLNTNVPVSEGGLHSYDGDEIKSLSGSSGRFSRFMMYNNGRLAWWPESYSQPFLAVVDDLRTRMRRVYLFPDHRHERLGYKIAMSDKLLLMGRGETLHAWHFELDTLRSVTIPDEFERCVTEGEMVLIVTRNAEVFLWKFGHHLQHIGVVNDVCYPKGRAEVSNQVHRPLNWTSPPVKTTLLLRDSGVLIDFIIDPSRNGSFFVITFGPLPQRQLIVYEIDNGEVTGTYVLDCQILGAVNMASPECLRWEKVDRHGGYSLINAHMVGFDDAGWVGDTGNNAPTICPCGSLGQVFVSVCFNVYTKSFTILYHHLSITPSWPYQIWNDRIVASCPETGRSNPTSDGAVVSVDKCTGRKQGTELGTYPLYSTMRSKSSMLTRRHRVASEDQKFRKNVMHADFALDPYEQFTPAPTDSELTRKPDVGTRMILGDDDFLLLDHGHHYTVWSFGDEIPMNHARDGEKKHWWRRHHRA